MVFNSIKAIEKDIEKKINKAMHDAQEKVHFIIDNFLNQYYNEFTPSEYIRTHQLLHSLVKSDVRKYGNSVQAEVYFDASAMNYENGFIKIKSTAETGQMGYATWGAHQVLDTAMHGTHGGYIKGTPIWDRSEAVLDRQAIDILVHSLQTNGIPIK